MFFNGLIVALLAFAASTELAAAPRIPQDDRVVLERLPGRRDDPLQAELRRLRTEAAARPSDPELAAHLARRYFQRANAEGDPRYIGYAEAALRNWPGEDAPTEVLFVRGLLRQYRHDFEGALEDFAATLGRDAGHFGAHAWRAAIYMVQARYAEASRECAALASEDGFYAAACGAYADAATGKLAAAYARLSQALRDAEPETGVRLWALTRLAEMAWRMGDAGAAERAFRDALALGEEDNFLLAAYADFLLEQNRPKEVVQLLKDSTRSDTLLLRLALAENKLGTKEAAAHVQALGERFAAAALRGERLHLGEEARYLLDLKGDPRAALAVGLENWKDQREPRDAQVVLEAAAAARDAAAAAPVLEWLRASGFESERMQRLAASLK